jgi:RimJ/RimL family protein N-acetyltransferase
MTYIPTLHSERLILRPHRLEEFDDYVAFWADPELNHYLGGQPSTREMTWSRVLRYAGTWHYLGFGFFAVEERGSGRFVGEAGFLEMCRDMTPIKTEGTLETGWVVAPSLQGKGYATEAVSTAIAWAQKQFPGRRMTCIIDPDNAASLRVAEKVGFQRLGITTYKDEPNVICERR